MKINERMQQLAGIVINEGDYKVVKDLKRAQDEAKKIKGYFAYYFGKGYIVYKTKKDKPKGDKVSAETHWKEIGKVKPHDPNDIQLVGDPKNKAYWERRRREVK